MIKKKNKDLHADWMPDQVGHDRKEEQGRSMVEMLGVLAVVGVLSVGGIAGYTYAMDKYYANELLMGASERAVLVAAQIVAGQEPNLNEFAGHTAPDGTFGEVKTDIEDGFGIAVSGVTGAVCENLIKATEGTDVYIANDDETLSEVTCSGDNNDFMFVFDYGVGGAGGETDPACVDVTCEDGLTCFHGECKCSTGLLKCGEQCCAEGTYCAKGVDTSTYTCAEPTSGCTKNSDCKDAEGNVDISKYCKFSGGSDGGPAGGTCTDKGELDDTNDFTVKTLNLPGGALTVYNSSGTMNWWSASNLCQAHGKQMVTMSDLGIADSGTNTDCYFDSSQSNYATYPCICNGGADSDCSATNAAIIGALGTSGKLWLADNDKSDSYSARTVPLSVGLVNGFSRTGRNGSTHSALCR